MANEQTPPSEIKGALPGIRALKQQEWKTFFEFLRQLQYQQIRSASPEKLIEIQHIIKAYDTVENQFEIWRK